MPKFDRRRIAEDLKESNKESHDTKDQGMFGASIFRSDAEIIIWKCNEGKHYIDIIPYQVGKFHPTKKEGKWAHYLDIWVHQRVGANEDNLICLLKNYKEPCPICEYRKEGDLDEEQAKLLIPKRRAIYNIICYDDRREEEKGVQIWDAAHFNMEQKLQSIAERPRQGGLLDFSDPDEGKQIMFERKGSGATNTQFLGHAFIDRDYKLPDEVLEQAYCLDELIVIPTYEMIERVLFGGKLKEREAPAPAPTPRGSRLVRQESAPAPEEVPRRRRREPEAPAESDNPCPSGGRFGVDIDKLDPCQTCTKYDACGDEYDRLEKEARAAQGGGRRLKR